MSPEEARRRLRDRLEHREKNFLHQVRTAIYDQPGMPYLRLLRAAGCELGDFERMVAQDGIEATLAALYRQGVYLTVHEFKGRRDVVRGSERFPVDPRALRNTTFSDDYLRQSGGSRGARVPVPSGAAQERERNLIRVLAREAEGGRDWESAFWQTHTVLISGVLTRALEGVAIKHWFTPTDPDTLDVQPRYPWTMRWIRVVGRLLGHAVPAPEYVPVDDPAPILRWMERTRAAGRTPHLHTSPSAAVRLCSHGQERGVRLDGVQLDIGGEPITAARLESIARSGARAVPRYSTSDGPVVSVGCLAPDAADDVHFPHDLAAMIQPGPEGASDELPPSALLVTNLHASAPFVALNVSQGDQAVMLQRACGCPIGALGLPTHLHTIRSFEKLTAFGMTFHDAEVIPALEEALPARFGGDPAHYQLVDAEAADGTHHLRLLVHPAVGPLDERAVADAFLTAISRGTSRFPIMAQIWREAGLPTVERRPPIMTAGGKVLHVHVEGRKSDGNTSAADD
jgi:hypothetical protein